MSRQQEKPAERRGRGSAARFALSALAVLNLFLVDQIVKRVAVARWSSPRSSSTAIPGFFDLCYVENRGAAWGMFQHNVLPLAVFSIAAFAFLLWKRKGVFGECRAGAVSEILLYSGLFGNLYDRLARGFVVDMFDFHWGDVWHFPVFNMADVFITCAAAILVFLSFSDTFKPRKTRRKTGADVST